MVFRFAGLLLLLGACTPQLPGHADLSRVSVPPGRVELPVRGGGSSAVRVVEYPEKPPLAGEAGALLRAPRLLGWPRCGVGRWSDGNGLLAVELLEVPTPRLILSLSDAAGRCD